MSSSYVTKIGRKQSLLLPDMIDNYIDENNPTRLFDSFVDSLDLSEMNFRYAVLEEGPGRPSYDPSDMLKLYLWSYYNGIRSSRKLENECHRNMEVMWLINKLTPDFKTISDFRKDNIDMVKSLFRKFNLFLKEQDFFKSHDIAVDGTKLKAVNSMDRSYTRAYLKREQDRIDERIEKYLYDMDENDAIEEDTDKEKIRKAIEKLREKKKELKEAEIKMNSSGMDEISLTDPDARQMKTRHGLDVCYNGHIAVESEDHLITDYILDNNTNDYASLIPLAQGTREFMDSFELSADKGHFSLPNLKELSEAHIIAYIPSAEHGNPKKKTGIPTPEYHKDRFLYDKSRDVYTCPQGNEMHYRFNWPNLRSSGVRYRIYSTPECMNCPARSKCSTSVRGRWIERWEYGDIEDEHWKRMKEKGTEKMILRKRTVEHPFGTIKRWMNQGYLLLKGLRKVKGEFGFSVIAYNMKRTISIKGVRTLIQSL